MEVNRGLLTPAHSFPPFLRGGGGGGGGIDGAAVLWISHTAILLCSTYWYYPVELVITRIPGRDVGVVEADGGAICFCPADFTLHMWCTPAHPKQSPSYFA